MTAEPEPRRDVTCCGELVIVAAVLAVSTGIVVGQRLRRWLGL